MPNEQEPKASVIRLPGDTYGRLKVHAKANRRTLGQQVAVMLDIIEKMEKKD